MRQFAVRELSLPDNGSYAKYANIKRPFVMWNVVATPELSLKPLQWCFPIAGCVEYKGFYDKTKASKFAEELRSKGYEVRVSGVPAYSTLGWFDDPILSTFITYPEPEVARILFHELAHQVAYAPGDTQFNEGFATTVEAIGVQRWLDHNGDETTRAQFEEHRRRKREFVLLLVNYKKQLSAVYESNTTDIEKRSKKAQVMSSLLQSYQLMKREHWNGYTGYDNWFNEPVTNAHLALIAIYEDLVPAFQSLYERSGSLPRFYTKVTELSKYDKAKRHQYLADLLLPSD
jgi:predicted aminopeptidase